MRLLAKIQAHGMQTKIYTLDNEVSRFLQAFLTAEGVTPLLVDPYVHRCNAAGWTIRTCNNLFFAYPASTNPVFLLVLWDLLIPQAIMTLNLLRGSHISLSLSAYTQLNGLMYFTKIPLTPLDIRTLIHEKSGYGNSWTLYAQPGWYIGPAMDHYRHYTVHMTKTRSLRFTYILTWFPSKVVMPVLTSTDILTT